MCLTRYGKLHYEAIKDKSTNAISIVSITSELQDHIDDKYNPINNISYNITNDDNDIDESVNTMYDQAIVQVLYDAEMKFTLLS
jgi:hypothetical protein